MSPLHKTGLPLEPAVDSHVHVLDPERFPLTNRNAYVPGSNECGTAHDLRAVLQAHGITHALLVTPFPGYGLDNACMLDAVARSEGRFKGVALIGHDADDRQLRTLGERGVVGARFNTRFPGATSLHGKEGATLLARMKAAGWFAEVYFHGDGLLDILPQLTASGVQIVVDHCGSPDVDRGLSQPGFQALLELGRSGNAVVKLSGAFRFSRQSWPYADVEPCVAALIDAFTLRNCVWASDWPFVRFPKRMDYGPLADLLPRWLPDAADRRQVLWETPRRCFGFSAPVASTPAR